MEGLLLYLPRLSAPHVFDLICPVEATHRYLMVHIPSTIHVCNLFNCSTLTCGKQFVNLTKFNSTPGVLPLVRKSDLMCVLLCILRWYPHSQAYPVLAVRFALTIIHRSSSLYYCQRKPKSESGASLGTRLLKSVVCT